ncbi:hypothetical protein ACJIZ3_018641 [Penstemon smallii]|uniref:SUN domain-containing protein n=1 Tax=Penstemon smallii TaxID=265156 RepID=A0ABD3SYX3_9LAMI
MSGSTVSITANQISTSRRRAVERTLPAGAPDNEDAAKITAADTAAAILKDARKTQPRKSGPTRKAKPRWLTVISILSKNLAFLVVLLGFVQMFRWVVFNSGHGDTEGFSVISGDLEGKVAEMEKFVKTTTKAMQVQLNAVDRKVDDEISSVRKEFDEKIEQKGDEFDLKFKALDVRSDAFEKFIDGFRKKSLLSKEDFDEFFEEFKKSRKNSGVEVSLDEIRDYARDIVEKEIERHAADGLGMVDYALTSGGGKVVKHSEPFGAAKGGSGGWLFNRNGVSAEAVKMISPSFGEPGHCFPLKGGSGFVEIKLRTAIIPEAVTLEHVAKSVAYDRSSAPKQCRVSGWLRGQETTDVEFDTNKMFLLTEFIYDLEKSSAQTFKVVKSGASNLVDTIRLDFTSNHGSASHTCIYRLRVHGHEPSFVPMLER